MDFSLEILLKYYLSLMFSLVQYYGIFCEIFHGVVTTISVFYLYYFCSKYSGTIQWNCKYNGKNSILDHCIVANVALVTSVWFTQNCKKEVWNYDFLFLVLISSFCKVIMLPIDMYSRK